jgi:hypothetical protein
VHGGCAQDHARVYALILHCVSSVWPGPESRLGRVRVLCRSSLIFPMSPPRTDACQNLVLSEPRSAIISFKEIMRVWSVYIAGQDILQPKSLYRNQLRHPLELNFATSTRPHHNERNRPQHAYQPLRRRRRLQEARHHLWHFRHNARSGKPCLCRLDLGEVSKTPMRTQCQDRSQP